MITDLIKVAKKLGKNSLTCDEYSKNGKFHYTTIINRFSSWNIALSNSNLKSTKNTQRRRYFNPTEEELIIDLQKTAYKLNKNTLLTSEYEDNGKYRCNTYINKYGSWETALITAGLQSTGYHKNITNDELLQNIEELWIKLGRQPVSSDIKDISKYGIQTYYRRFGSWRKALENFIEYINSNNDNVVENKNNKSKTITKKSCFITKENGINCTETHKTKREINFRLRFKVMQRDNFKCCICGASPAKNPDIELHIDHIIPWSKGGETEINNLQTLCSKCNLGKSDLEM